ncbi:MAG: DUF934 domain-containing protein [Arenicellales bacterium]
MSLIINRKIQDNRCSHLDDDAPLAPGDVTVSLERWVRERDAFHGHDGRVGVRLVPGDSLDDLGPFVDELELIALVFDKFAEGRGYSQAYLLRERHGFKGELRAIGARRDHVMYMERCGMDAFEPVPPETAADLLQGFDEITVRYQPSEDRIPLIFRRRAHAAAPQSEERSA